MLPIPLLLCLTVLTLPAAPPPPVVDRSVAVMGVEKSLALVVGSALADEVRQTGAFSRVISTAEVEALIGLEARRQMLDCDNGSCMADLAGAMGVRFVLMGSLARLTTGPTRWPRGIPDRMAAC